MANQLGLFERLLGELAEIVLESSSPAVLWPAVMDHLARSVGFDAAFIASTTGTVAEAVGAVFDHSETAVRAQIGPYLSQIVDSEVHAYLDRTRPAHEVWDERRRCEMASLYAPLHPGRARDMLVRVGYRNGILLGFNLQRAPRSRPFNSREIGTLDALAPLVQVGDALWRSRHITPSVRAWVAQWKLTRREADVAELVMRGLQNHEIAQALRLSPNTVRNALSRVFPKADVSTRAELVFLAHQATGGEPARPVRNASRSPNEMDAYFERVRRASSLVNVRNDAHRAARVSGSITYIAPASEVPGP